MTLEQTQWSGRDASQRRLGFAQTMLSGQTSVLKSLLDALTELLGGEHLLFAGRLFDE